VLQGRIKIHGSGPPVGPAKSPEEREVGPGKTFSINASSPRRSPTYVSSTLPRLSLWSLDARFRRRSLGMHSFYSGSVRNSPNDGPPMPALHVQAIPIDASSYTLFLEYRARATSSITESRF
jgi:hypothetical protein